MKVYDSTGEGLRRGRQRWTNAPRDLLKTKGVSDKDARETILDLVLLKHFVSDSRSINRDCGLILRLNVND